jgi:2'-5' RNA ligase
MSRIRAFVALPLDESARRALADAVLRERSLPREQLRFVPRENFHLTLRFLGDIDEETVPLLLVRLRECLAGLRPFSCRLASLVALPSPRRARLVAALPSDELALRDLAARVESAAVDAGFAREPRAVLAHVTVARAQRPPLRNFALAPALPPVPIPVDAVALFRSHLARDGARYETLASLPFAASEPLPHASLSPGASVEACLTGPGSTRKLTP